MGKWGYFILFLEVISYLPFYLKAILVKLVIVDLRNINIFITALGTIPIALIVIFRFCLTKLYN